MSTKNTWKSFGGIYKTQEITNLGIGTLIVDEVITRKKILETLVFNQILSLENNLIQTSGDLNTYGTGKFNLNTFHNQNIFVKNKIVFAGGNSILQVDDNDAAQGALIATVGGSYSVPNGGSAINFLYGDATKNRVSIGTTVPTSFLHIYQSTSDTQTHTLCTIETGKTSATVELLKTNSSSGMIDIYSNSSTTQQRFIASNNVNGTLSSTSNRFTINNNGTNKSIHIDSYDVSINSTNNTEINSLNNTIINSQYIQVKGQSIFSNKNVLDERLNETLVIYDNSENTYLNSYYNVSDYKTGNALTISSSDIASNAFQHIITPNYKGFGIGGGVIVTDNTKSMGTMGILIDDSSSTDSSFVPGITVYETGNKTVNRSITSINTFLPNTTSHSMAINGATHIGHGELYIRAYANFYIQNVSFSKQDPLYGIASGKTVGSTTLNKYDYYYLETKDGGSTWTVYNMDNNTFRDVSDLLLYAYPIGLQNSSTKSFLIDRSSNNNNKVGFIEKQNNVSSGWNVNTTITHVKVTLFHVNYNIAENEYQIIAKNNSSSTNIYISAKNFLINSTSTYIDLATNQYGYSSHNLSTIFNISGSDNIIYILGVNALNKIIVIKYNIYDSVIGNINNSSIIYDYFHNTNITYATYVPNIYAYSTDSVVIVGNNFITYSNNASITGATWTTITNTGYKLNQLHLPNERNAIAFGTRISDSKPVLMYSNDYYHTWQEVEDNILNASGLKHIMTDALNGTNVSIHMSSLSTIIVSYVISATESRIVYGHLPYLLNKEYNSVLDISGNMQISGVVYQF